MKLTNLSLAALLSVAMAFSVVAPGCSCAPTEVPTAQSEIEFERESSDKHESDAQQESPEEQSADETGETEAAAQSEDSEASSTSLETSPSENSSANEKQPESEVGGGTESSGDAEGDADTRKRSTSTGKAEKRSVGGSLLGAGGVKYTAAEAHRNAQKAMTSANATAKAGNPGRAFEIALKGWQQAQAHAESDAACRALAKQLLSRLETYGEKANRNISGGVDGTKPLVTR